MFTLCREMAEMDRDGRLNLGEFRIAMHLIYWSLKGQQIPTTLPQSLILQATKGQPLMIKTSKLFSSNTSDSRHCRFSKSSRRHLPPTILYQPDFCQWKLRLHYATPKCATNCNSIVSYHIQQSGSPSNSFLEQWPRFHSSTCNHQLQSKQACCTVFTTRGYL